MKRLILVFAVLMLLVFFGIIGVKGVVAAPVDTIPTPIYGDANGDHAVNAADITKIYREIMEVDPFTPGADANRNGIIDMGDVVYVSRQILKLSPVYGDADGNCIVNQADIEKVPKIILKLAPSTPGADANRDGVVNAADITMIQRMILS